MQAMFNKSRDKARELLYRAAQFLGEGHRIKPASHRVCVAANKSLQVDLPAFTHLLPYETVDDEGFFVNHNSVGFGFSFTPMPGADESLMKALAELFKNKLPPECDCTFMLYKHHYLSDALNHSFSPILEQGGVYAELARKSIDFHLKAVREGYPNNRNLPAQLADYQGYLFVSVPRALNYQPTLQKIRADFASELKVAGFAFSRIEAQEFVVLLRTLTTPNLNEIAWPKIAKNPDLFLSERIASPATVYEISDTAIDITSRDERGNPSKTRVVNCALTGLSRDQFALWQTPDFFANLLRPEQGVQCPFLLSFTVRGANQDAMKTVAKRRAKSLNANSNAIQSFLNPGMVDEAADWQLAHTEMHKGSLDLVSVFYNLMLFTTEQNEQEQVAKAISSYRNLGFTLTPSRLTQWLRYLASLPFMLSEGLFDSLKTLGLTQTVSHYNAANLAPVVADFKGSPIGLLLPTYRNQLFYYDPFDDVNLPITNFNRLTVASPGAGKSYFQQALILDGLSRGHQIFVIDLGESYKHLCQLVGGTYIDATTITLNPFTLFDFDGVTEIAGESVNNYIQIRDLLAIMASPDKGLDEVQKDWLLDAILIAWREKLTKTCIDDVLTALKIILQKPEAADDRRLKDLIVLLGKYGRGGIYGATFNGETPLLNGSSFTVLEMGGFESNPQLLTIVMFAMIVIIQGQFYHSDRRIKKQCNFDEMWRVFMAGSNPLSANFLEQGYRTARKYNAGFSAITQNLSDTEKTLQGQAISASSDTKIIMRQGAFKEYIEKHPDAFNPMQQQMISSFGEAKMQGFSNLMIQYGTAYTFHRYFSDPYSRILFSTTGEEFGAIEAMVAAGMSLDEAIVCISQELYGAGA